MAEALTARQRLDIMIDWMRSMKGVEVSPQVTYFNTEASRDNLRRFAECVSNPNPLYFDEAYAKKSKYGRVVAPPNFLLSVACPNAHPGRHTWIGAIDGQSNIGNFASHAGADMEWYKPIFYGDTFTFTHTLTDIVEKVGRQMGPAYLYTGDVVFKNQRDEKVAKFTGWVFIGEGTALKKGLRRWPFHDYKDEELRAIDENYRSERSMIQGSKPRYWEDVRVGEELPPLARGPMLKTDLLAWSGGGGVPGSSQAGRYRIAAAEVSDLPQWRGKLPGIREATTAEAMLRSREHPKVAGVLGGIGQILYSDSDPGGFGVSHAYEQQRYAWGAIPLLHWMGDDGFLKRLRLQMRAVNRDGDTTWWKGRVTAKEVVDGEHLVHFDYWGENQLGAVTMPGSATVLLPSRG